MTSNSGRITLIGALVTFALFATVLMMMRPLMAIDETRYLTVAWEMWQGGSKFVPHLNGEIYSHKPPLLFWLVNLAWAAFGQSEWVARLVAPAFGLLSVYLVGRLARALWPDAPERAGLAALILASSGLFLLYGSTTMFDTMLSAATLIGMLAIWSLQRGLRLGPVIGLGVALALGVLAKGPVILVHVMPAALLMPLWAAREGRVSIARWYGRIALAFAIALGLVLIWLGPAMILGGADYREQILWKQSAGRMVQSFAHGRPVWFFIALLPLYLWPWGWSRAGLAALKPSRLWADPGTRMVSLWALAALIAFSLISGKQAHYLVPEMPALALLLSGMVPAGAPRHRAWRLGWLLPALGVAIAVACVPFGAFPELPEGTGSWLFWGLGLGVLALAALIVLRAHAGWRAEAWAAPLSLVAIQTMVWPILWPIYDPTPLGALLSAHAQHGVATTDSGYAGQFSYAGRLNPPVEVLENSAELGRWMAAHPGGIVLAPREISGVAGLGQIAERHFRQQDWRLYQVASDVDPDGTGAPASMAQ